MVDGRREWWHRLWCRRCRLVERVYWLTQELSANKVRSIAGTSAMRLRYARSYAHQLADDEKPHRRCLVGVELKL